MAIVLDASAIVPLALDDEDAVLAIAVVSAIARQGGLVPPLFWYEIANVLCINEPRGRVTPAQTENFFADLSDLPIEIDLPPRPMEVLKVARRCSLTAYDAAYLELALRTESTLATLDNGQSRKYYFALLSRQLRVLPLA